MNSSCRVSKLTKSDKLLFSSIMSLAFAQDPLFLHAFGDTELDRKSRSRAAAFVSFMFDKSLLLNEEIWGFLNSYMEITRSAAPSSPHHYLIMIGVNPEVQGRGIGTAMLLHLLQVVHADNKSHGIALDTENKGNVNLYQRWGFALRHEENINDLTVYCMFYQK